MRVLALDVGDKRIGVALSDPQGLLASPMTVLEREGSEVEAILDLVQRHEVEEIVVGMPRSLGGGFGYQAEKVRAFIQQLSSLAPVPIATWDEWLTTVAAERAMLEADAKRAKRRALRDAVAAALILQGYLDSRGHRPSMEGEGHSP
ncbi:MAG: Holliday junction resolvase RuvX [Chloroflexi bacterium]|nr:Holliday junction resolvase RuvX [Chloroflexota bacterium]